VGQVLRVNGGGVGERHRTGWAESLALLFVLGGMLHLAVEAIPGVVS
jgi:hypothetical protein